MQENKVNKTEWFEEWFDSSYYHTLYKKRDFKEAENFIDKLMSYLKPKTSDVFLDAACGKGRHSIYINNLGYSIDAFDLSKNSILAAKEYEKNNLTFYVNDIRNPLKRDNYQFVLNLFTSFGYFKDEVDNFRTVKAFADSITPSGIVVLDFMNANKVIKNLVDKESKTIDNICFNINRKIENKFILKNISFSDNGKDYTYTEEVKAIQLEDFEEYFKQAGLKIKAKFGDYNLNDFNIESSDRLILVAEK